MQRIVIMKNNYLTMHDGEHYTLKKVIFGPVILPIKSASSHSKTEKLIKRTEDAVLRNMVSKRPRPNTRGR